MTSHASGSTPASASCRRSAQGWRSSASSSRRAGAQAQRAG
jgi:hypothetical protein